MPPDAARAVKEAREGMTMQSVDTKRMQGKP
jgi:hypothetical protein